MSIRGYDEDDRIDGNNKVYIRVLIVLLKLLRCTIGSEKSVATGVALKL